MTRYFETLIQKWMSQPEVQEADDEDKQFLAETGAHGQVKLTEGKVQAKLGADWKDEDVMTMLTTDGFLSQKDAELMLAIMKKNRDG